MSPSLRTTFHFALVVAAGVLASGLSLATARGTRPESETDPKAANPLVEELRGVSCQSETCHTTWRRKKSVHRPVEKQSCLLCHTPENVLFPSDRKKDRCVATWKLLRPEQELCVTCHPLSLRNIVHLPVAEGKCSACHDPHASDEVHLLRQDPGRDLCFSCHQHDEERYKSPAHPHEPARAGACILCHEAHSSWNEHLLVKTGAALCRTCHEDIEASMAARRHIHEAARNDCQACHDPHGADQRGMLRAAPKEVCLGCHSEIGQLLATSTRVHGALDEDASCLNCHSPHASDLPRLLSRSLLDTCLTCHDKPVKTPEGRVLTNMASRLRNNPSHHGPIVRADCSSCHEPHASPNFRLLRENYPEEFYLPQFSLESYSLCFRCHFRELVLVERGPGITRFQHGDLNLHYVHVNREKSRTCRACHAVHASKNPAHLVDTFTFGQWKDAPLGYEKLPNGGKCAPACHKAVRYERGSKEPVPVVK